MTRLVRRLVPLAGDRLACAVQFFLLAAVLSAANVMLDAIASTLFLVERGPGELPLFYLVLAAASIPLAAALSMVIDRWSRIRIFQGLMLLFAAAAVALWLLMPLGLAAVPYAIYLGSYALDINGPLIFWVLASEYFTTLDLKRSAVALAMGLAFGGALGGGAITLLYGAVGAADLLLLLPPLFLVMIGQVDWLGRSLEPIGEAPAGPEEGQGDERSLIESLRRLPMLMLRYPLALLMAASLLLMTVLYCLQQYLVFIVYAAAFPDPDDLARFLAMLYAGLQIAEFVLLYAVSRPLMTRCGPALRNAVFPLTTLASLSGFALTFQLPAAVLCQGNFDAVSNAVYEPVHTLNFTALPLRVLGRVRTVADGMIYPAALALGGALLLLLQSHLTLFEVAAVALLGGLALLAVNIAVGRSFLPTLVKSLRAGAVTVADVAESLRTFPASFAADVRRLLESDDAESCAVGLALARRLDSALVLEPVCALARGADPTARRGIAAVLARAPAAAAAPVVVGFLASDDAAQQTLALQVALARDLQLDAARLARLCDSQVRPVATLARLAAGNSDAPSTGASPPAGLVRGIADLETGEILIETIALGGRPGLASLVVAVVRDAPPLLKARALAALAAFPEAGDASVASLAEALSADADPAVRAEALRLLAGLAPAPARLARFAAGLEDPDRRVRRQAAEALAAHGDQAIGLLRGTPRDATDDLWEATVWALARMQSRPAHKLLRALLAPTLERAAENAALLAQLQGARDPGLWRPLEVALADSNARLVERVLKVLTALPRDRVVVQLRRALASTDLRTRASAVEALSSLPDRGLIAAALPLIEAVSAVREVPHQAPHGHNGDEMAMAVLDQAESSWDRWVRRGTAAVRSALAGGLGEGFATGEQTEVDMELLVFLKRTPLFGSLPLDTLLALSRVLVPESYVAGETVFADGSPGHCLYLVRSGTVEVLKDERLLTRLGPGTYVGEMALIDDAPRSARVVVVEDCTLLRLDRAAFQDLTEDYPAMLRELCKLLAANLREANRSLADPDRAQARLPL